MSKYADLFLLPIFEENVPAYKKLALTAGKAFLKHGALRYREYVASDLNAEGLVSFTKLLKLKPGETVIYAAVEFKSEAHRNAVLKKFMQDPELTPSSNKPMPFNVKRMAYGGFKILVDL